MTHVTSADVARVAGISRGAVSQILNGQGERFLPATRERVLEAARALAYEPSSAGRTLARGTSDVVVAVIPHTTFGGNLQDILDVLTERLAEHGLLLVARFSTAGTRTFDRFVASLRPAAVISLGRLPPEALDALRKRGVVFVGPSGPEAEREAGHATLGGLQAQHLHARGHDRLCYALLRDGRDDVYGPARLYGFQQACADLGLPPPDLLEVRPGADASTSDAQLADLGQPLGIGCYNDDVALTLLSCAARLALRLPDELALIGVDHTPLGQAVSPRLSTIAYDAAVVAEVIAHRVLSAIRARSAPGESSPATEYRVVQGETT